MSCRLATTPEVPRVPRGPFTTRMTEAGLTLHTTTHRRPREALATARRMLTLNTAWRRTTQRPRIPMSALSEESTARRANLTCEVTCDLPVKIAYLRFEMNRLKVYNNT